VLAGVSDLKGDVQDPVIGVAKELRGAIGQQA